MAASDTWVTQQWVRGPSTEGHPKAPLRHRLTPPAVPARTRDAQRWAQGFKQHGG